MEAFISIHMSLFVLMPLSKIISKENSKRTFWILFVIRIAILLFFDLFITKGIAIIDFILVFVGAFIIIPIASIKDKEGVVNDVPINNNEEQENIETSAETVTDNSPIVLIDPTYLNNESALLKNIVKEEIESQGENVKKLTTSKINTKRNIVILIFGLLTFICVLMYFFNIELKTCLMCEGITLLLYIFLVKKFNIVNAISMKAKKNPNEDIAKLVTEVKINKKQVVFPIFLKTGITVLAAIFIPVIMFAKPKLLYFRYGDGYAVIKYTKGAIQQSDTVVIPDTHNGKNVVAIANSAFENTKIKNITLSQNLESIKSKAFFNCKNLESIYIPQNVTEIRASAFKNDKKLSKIELPESLEYLGAGAFSHCSSLQEITIPSKVVEINGQTFEYCISLRRINLHDNIISIHGENFVGCKKLDNVTLPSKITEIRGNTFENCTSLSSIVIPKGVTRIGGHAFYGCSNLSYVIVPSTVVEIGSSAFRQCTSLRSIHVPKNAVINERAFKESPTSVIYY